MFDFRFTLSHLWLYLCLAGLPNLKVVWCKIITIDRLHYRRHVTWDRYYISTNTAYRILARVKKRHEFCCICLFNRGFSFSKSLKNILEFVLRPYWWLNNASCNGYTAHQYRKFYESVHTMLCVFTRKVYFYIALIVMILLPIFSKNSPEQAANSEMFTFKLFD